MEAAEKRALIAREADILDKIRNDEDLVRISDYILEDIPNEFDDVEMLETVSD